MSRMGTVKKWVVCPVILFCMFVLFFMTYAWAESEESDYYPYLTVSGNVRGGMHVEFLYSDSMLLADTQSFSTDLAKASVCLAGAGYETGYINPMLTDMGFRIIDNYRFTPRSIDDNDHVAYTIGKKTINGISVYCLVIRGTYANEEWFSNMNLGKNNGGNHVGFYNAADEVLLDIALYADSNSIVWVTGHSRGAAVANIVAARLSNYLGEDHVFGYTFACPNVSKNVTSKSYDNIYNINNSGDLISAIPFGDAAWSNDHRPYGRFGHTYTWNLSSDILEMGNQYQNEVGEEYSGANDTITYVSALKRIVPTEDDYFDRNNYFGMMVFAYIMQDSEHGSTTLLQFLDKYGGEWLDQYIYEKLQTINNIMNWPSTLFEAKDETDEAAELVNEISSETIGYTEDEFTEYLNDKHDKVMRVFDLTGEVIKRLDDVPVVYSKVIKYGKAAYKLGEIIGYVLDLCNYSTGNILRAIPNAHRPESYIMAVNHKYFGYKGYYACAIDNLSLPASITTLGPSCFENSTGAPALILENINAIGDNCFYGCAISELTIPETIKSFGATSLAGMKELRTLTIPLDLLSRDDLFCRTNTLGYGIYDSQTNGLTTLHITKGSGHMEDIEYCNGYYQSRYLTEMCSCTLTTVILDEGITNIGKNMFCDRDSGSAALDYFEISIPSTVTAIGENAFAYRNWGSGTLTIPNTVTSIGASCFSFMNITEIIIPESLSVIPYEAFRGCTSLTELVIPDTVTTLEPGCFAQLNDLQTLTLPVEFLTQNDAFCLLDTSHNGVYQTNNVTTIHITKGLTGHMGDVDNYNQHSDHSSALTMMCIRSLNTVTIDEGVVNIGNNVFSDYQHEAQGPIDISLPSTITCIGDNAFGNRSLLNPELIIPDSVTSLGDECFAFTNIESLVIPDNITAIPACAFKGCSSLTELVIPDTVEELGICCFAELTGLRKLTIPVDLLTNANAFCELYTNGTAVARTRTNGLLTLNITKGSSGHMGDFIAYSHEYSPYITQMNMHGLSEIIIDEGVTNIGQNAFYYNSENTTASDPITVSVPATVTTIGNRAFYGAERLNEIELPDSISEIEEGAFSRTGLVSLSVPDGVSVIPDICFSECERLKEITIHENVSGIGIDAFAACDNLKSVFVESMQDIMHDQTGLSDTDIIIYCYRNSPTEIWARQKGLRIRHLDLENILVLPAEVKEIESEAFCGLPDIDAIRIPAETTGIAEDAFDEGIFLLIPADSIWVQWARENGYVVIEE